MTCRPDWEAVLTPVLDTLTRRADVDPERIAAIGISHGAYLLTRALCFEHRLAAAVADPGIIDLAVPWLELLSPALRRHLETENRTAFDREMHITEMFSPALSATLRSPIQKPQIKTYGFSSVFRVGGDGLEPPTSCL